MAELTFYYGVMGCAKSANALMTRWDYLSCNRNVWLIKPSIDTRDNIVSDGKVQTIIKSRVGISAVADVVKPDEHITVPEDIHAIICDEATAEIMAHNAEQERIAEEWRAAHPFEEKIRAVLSDPMSSVDIAEMAYFFADKYLKEKLGD